MELVSGGKAPGVFLTPDEYASLRMRVELLIGGVKVRLLVGAGAVLVLTEYGYLGRWTPLRGMDCRPRDSLWMPSELQLTDLAGECAKEWART